MNRLSEATRVLQRRPGVAIVIVAILGVGIGLTTSVFSLFHQILIRPLPVAEAEQLVNLSQAPFPVFSYPMFHCCARSRASSPTSFPICLSTACGQWKRSSRTTFTRIGS